MKTIFTVILVLAASFISFCPVFDYNWLVTRIDRQKEIAALEAKVLKVMRITAVIKHIESRGNYDKPGDSGEIGAYQFMPKTWKNACKKYVGKYLIPTKENQDLIAFRSVEDLVSQKYSISQIASIWNSGYPNCTKVGITITGVPFDVPAYRAYFVKMYKIIKV
ncbi:MAG: hypothetical protein PHT07_15450 [Paludibacter sp.]|nr:hypothetical protein [Paludibacter sp.]